MWKIVDEIRNTNHRRKNKNVSEFDRVRRLKVKQIKEFFVNFLGFLYFWLFWCKRVFYPALLFERIRSISLFAKFSLDFKNATMLLRKTFLKLCFLKIITTQKQNNRKYIAHLNTINLLKQFKTEFIFMVILFPFNLVFFYENPFFFISPS